MKIAIHTPVGFNETGGRSNNEDSIFPLVGTATAHDRIFLVCDGVGGEHKGEVASALACESMHTQLSGFNQPLTPESIKTALAETTAAFEAMELQDPGTSGMATTMTVLSFQRDGVAVAHLGDSRIYHVRNGVVLFKTRDHKWVNELVESGVITAEQAREHPKRNVITRVITAGRNDQPDFQLIHNVQKGDYFFMCTDGVLEQLYDDLLLYHLRDDHHHSGNLEEIMAAIREECAGKTNDNFSAYLLQVASVENEVSPVAVLANEDTFVPGAGTVITPETSERVSSRKWAIPLIVAAVAITAGGVFYLAKDKKAPEVETVQVVDSPKTTEPVIPPDPVETQPVKTLRPVVSATLKKPVKKAKEMAEPAAEPVILPEAIKPTPAEDPAMEDPFVKTAKSDLPAKLKKADPKPDEQP